MGAILLPLLAGTCSDAIRGNSLVRPSYRQLSPALNSTFGERLRVALFAIQN